MTLLVASPLASADVDERPLPPTALVVQAEVEGNRLDWLPPAANAGDVNVYNVYRVNGTVREQIATVPASQTTYLDADISPDHLYTYSVTSQSAGGESVPSNPSTANYPRCYEVIGPEGVKTNCFIPFSPGIIAILLD